MKGKGCANCNKNGYRGRQGIFELMLINSKIRELIFKAVSAVEIRKMVEPMKVGDISEVLRGARGYQILKLESRSTPVTMPFEQARADIGNRMANDRRNEEFQKYLTKLRAQAIIQWMNQDLKKAYDLGLSQAKVPGTAPAL